MRKAFAFVLVFFSFTILVAQQTFIDEDFSGTWPPEGWTISAQASNWSVVNTANAGGTAPELRFSWTPQFIGETRLITESIDLSSADVSMLVFSFKHRVFNFSGNYQIGVSARTKQGAWTNLWSQTVTGNIPAQTRAIQITDPDLLSSDELQLSFFFSGNSYNIDFWFIDDVNLYSPLDFDLALTGLSVPSHFMGEKAITGTVTVSGLQEINSFDLNWKIDDGEVQTQHFSGLNLGFFDTYNFSTTELIDLEPGTYTLTVSISNINGEDTDDNPANNEFSKAIHIAHQYVQRLPLFESFTSSTCPPCFTFNNNFFNNFTQQNQNELALIKYQMSWPGSGDPYYTAEGGVRRSYYAVSGVPSLVVEGKMVATAAAAVNTAFNAAKAEPAFLSIDGYHMVDGNHILIEAELMPYADYPDATIHVVVIEGTTTGNVGTNGETFFKHVMMKMLPDASGTAFALQALEPYHISYNFNMSGTFVEEMEDLKVVIFVQNHATREVYQAGYTTKPSAPEASINIEDGAIGISLSPTIEIDFDQAVRHTDGSEITPENIALLVQLRKTDADGEEIPFTAEINEEKMQISLEPAEPFEEGLLVFVHMDAVSEYSPFLLASDPQSITFTTLSTVSTPDLDLPGLVVFPNPTSNIINARFNAETVAELRILDMGGNLVVSKAGVGQSFQMDVSALANGIYLLEIITDKGKARQKISIIR